MGAVFSRPSQCCCPLSTRRQYNPTPEQGDASDMTIEQRLDALTGQLHSLEQRMKENMTEQTHSLEQRMKENLTEQTHSLEQRMIENLTEQTHSLEQRMIENLTEQTHSLEQRMIENLTEQTHSLEQCMKENLTEQTHSLEQCIDVITEQTHSLEQCNDVMTEQTHSLQQRFDVLEQLFQHPQPSEETLPKLTAAAVTFDPVLSTLEPCSSMETSVEDDRRSPYITAVLIINSLYVFMADINNSKIKVFTLTAPHRPQPCVQLNERPYGLAMVTGRQQVAVTSPTAKVIVLVDVTTTPVVSKSIPTGRRYLGVGSCDDGTLVVSCMKEGQLPASVDVITLKGVVVRTVTSSNEVNRLVRPAYLCVSGGTLYLSDDGSDCVHQADLVTGQVTTQLRHQNLQKPGQVTVDLDGNLYMACRGSSCVLVRSAAGEWRKLLEREQDGERDRVCAQCVCVTDTGLLLVGWDREGWLDNTVVKVYQLT